MMMILSPLFIVKIFLFILSGDEDDDAPSCKDHIGRFSFILFSFFLNLVEDCVDDSFHIYLGGGYNYYSLHLV